MDHGRCRGPLAGQPCGGKCRAGAAQAQPVLRVTVKMALRRLIRVTNLAGQGAKYLNRQLQMFQWRARRASDDRPAY